MINNILTILLARTVFAFAKNIVAGRSPDVVIGRSGDGGGYLRRWFIIRRKHRFNVYLHAFFRDDPDVPHDHPWWSISLSLRGVLHEAVRQPDGSEVWREIPPGTIVYRSSTFAHRLHVPDRGAMTLFVTGPKVRDWGFICPRGWRHWRDFVGHASVERGCGEP